MFEISVVSLPKYRAVFL